MKEIVDQSFFNRDTIKVAKDLLGLYLVIKVDGETKSLMINEVEAYIGPDDKASHAHKGKTERTKLMFGSPGYIYIYLIYGMYWMLNIVTQKEGYPAAILIRGAGDIDGPGKLTRDLKIDKSFNGKELTKENGLWIERRGNFSKKDYHTERTPRIGVSYANEWAKKPYRFVLKNKKEDKEK